MHVNESTNIMSERPVILERPPVLELLPGEDKTLLVRGDALFVLDFRLHILDRVCCFHFKRDSLSGESLDEDLHTTAEAQHQVQRTLLLNVVQSVRK